MVCIHGDRPKHARGLCKSCYDKFLKQRDPEYAERQKQNTRNWAEKRTPEQAEKDRKRYAARQKDPKHKRAKRESRLKKKYGITIDDYEAMLRKQNGCCAICERKPGKRSLHVDHCHDTGRVRGLLCFRCNFGLSWFNEDQELLRKAARYVKR